MTRELRRQLIETAQAMNNSGLNKGTSGNLSVRFNDGFLITPSGMDYASLEEDDIVGMTLDGNPEGKRRPSSEWRFHAAIYQHRAEAKAVLHAHPVNSTALACLERGIPAFHYMVAVAGGKDIRCAKYATFGSQELSDHVVEALLNRKACLMAHHGLTCFGNDLSAALKLALEVEQLAAMFMRIIPVGEPNFLSDKEMETVIRKFAGYGSQAQED
jgi:L-fuculose-phosphate aldolase